MYTANAPPVEVALELRQQSRVKLGAGFWKTHAHSVLGGGITEEQQQKNEHIALNDDDRTCI